MLSLTRMLGYHKIENVSFKPWQQYVEWHNKDNLGKVYFYIILIQFFCFLLWINVTSYYKILQTPLTLRRGYQSSEAVLDDQLSVK